MILSLQGPMDIGTAVGVDDTVFDNKSKVAAFAKAIGLQVEVRKDAEEPFPHLMWRVDVGTGLRVDLMGSPLLQNWWSQAQSLALDAFEKAYPGPLGDICYFPYERHDKSEVREYIRLSFENPVIERAYIDYYALGCAFFRMDIVCASPPSFIAEFARHLTDAPEESNIASALRTQVQAFLDSFSITSGDVVMTRKVIDSFKDDEISPMLMFLVICDEDDSRYAEVCFLIERYEHEHELIRLSLDEGELTFGYAAAALRDTGDREDILYPLQIAQVCCQVLDSFQNYLAQQSLEAAKHSIARSDDANAFLNDWLRLRTLCEAAVQMTNLSSMSNYLTHLMVFSAFENVNRFEEKRANLRQTSGVFAALTREAMERHERRREQRVTRFLVFFTALTSLGVMGQVLNTIDYDFRNVPSYLHRAEWLVVPAVLTILTALIVLKRR